MKRVFLIVLDSVGIGEMPDAVDYKDVGSNTLKAASTNYLADGSYIPENKEWQIPEGFRPLPVHRAIVLGQGGLVKTGFSGEMDAKMFVKPLGSTGVLDPIDQRQSIGFKINSIGFKAVRNEAIQVYHCIPSTAV